MNDKEILEVLEAALLELESNKVVMVGPDWASKRTLTGGAILKVARAINKITKSQPTPLSMADGYHGDDEDPDESWKET